MCIDKNLWGGGGILEEVDYSNIITIKHMGHEAVSGAKEASLSIEDWEGRIKPAVDLYRATWQGAFNIRRQEWIYSNIKNKDGSSKREVTYDINIEAIEGLPGFKDLVDEFNEMLAASVGGDVTAGSDIRERIYKRKEELERKREDLRKADPLVSDVVLQLAIRFSKRLDAISQDEVKIVIDDVLSKKEKHEYDSAEHQEFLNLRGPANAAFDGAKAEEDLARQDAQAKKRGFPSRQEMWQHDLAAIKALRKRIGDERFKMWDSVGSFGGLSYTLDRMEKAESAE